MVKINPNSKICFLHIGAPKTGSTALEKFLSFNQQNLANVGWVYPDISIRGFGHHDLAFLLSGGYPEWATTQEMTLEDLVKDLEVKLSGVSKCIISSENFFLFPNPKGIAEALENAQFFPENVKVFVYCRRQDEAHISWYNQAVKAQGYSGSITECISENMMLWDYAHRLGSWAEVFGKNNLIVRPYQKSDILKGDIRCDFLNIAGLPSEDFVWPEEEINTRINADILEFQRNINSLPLNFREKRCFHKHLIELTAQTKDMELFDDPPLLSIKQRKEILSEYAESNREVALTYLGRESLFNENMHDEKGTQIEENGLNIQKLIYIFSWILARNTDIST